MRRVLIIILSLVMALALAGCGIVGKILDKNTDDIDIKSQNSENVEKNTPKTDKDISNNPEETTLLIDEIELDLSGENPEHLGICFFKSILNDDYDSIIPLVFEDDTPFVNDTDIEYAIKRLKLSESFSEIDKTRQYKVETNLNNLGETATVQVRIEDVDNASNTWEVTLQLYMTKKSIWKLKLAEDLVVNNWTIQTPSGFTLSIDGMEVPSEYAEQSGDNINSITYTIPYIGKSEKEIVVISDLADLNEKIYAGDYKNGYEALVEVDDDLELRAYEYIAAMRTDILTGVSEEDIDYLDDIKTKYAGGDDPDNIAEMMYNSAREHNGGAISGRSYKDFEVTRTIEDINNESIWITDTKMHVYLGMSAQWKRYDALSKDYVTDKMDNYTDVILEYIDGEFRVAEITDDWLFANNFSRDSF